MQGREAITGRHAVLQALRSAREVHSVLVARESAADAALKPIQQEAARRGLSVRYVTSADLVRTLGAATQGVGALVGPLGDFSVKDLVARARAAGEPALVVAVDGVEDPQNLGAIARSALLAGAHGLVLPERGTASIGPGAVKAASGAFSLLPVAHVANLRTALEGLRREGLWLLGADAHGGKPPWSLDLRTDLALVLGSESHGLSGQALDAIDARACIPTPGGDLSLNVGAAAAVLLFECVRQRGA